jgi:hypothetical protein
MPPVRGRGGGGEGGRVPQQEREGGGGNKRKNKYCGNKDRAAGMSHAARRGVIRKAGIECVLCL